MKQQYVTLVTDHFENYFIFCHQFLFAFIAEMFLKGFLPLKSFRPSVKAFEFSSITLLEKLYQITRQKDLVLLTVFLELTIPPNFRQFSSLPMGSTVLKGYATLRHKLGCCLTSFDVFCGLNQTHGEVESVYLFFYKSRQEPALQRREGEKWLLLEL